MSRSPATGSSPAEELDFDAGVARADLTFEAVDDGRHCAIEYRAELFDERRVQRMAEHFQVLARSVRGGPDGADRPARDRNAV